MYMCVCGDCCPCCVNACVVRHRVFFPFFLGGGTCTHVYLFVSVPWVWALCGIFIVGWRTQRQCTELVGGPYIQCQEKSMLVHCTDYACDFRVCRHVLFARHNVDTAHSKRILKHLDLRGSSFSLRGPALGSTGSWGSSVWCWVMKI